MKYSCYTLNNVTWQLRRTEFLSVAATAFLDECDDDVYDRWEVTFPTHKSLSPIVNSVILDGLDASEDVVDVSRIGKFCTLRAFNNSKYSGDTCLSIFQHFKDSNGAEIVIYIPSAEFKKKFRFDSTYMTIEQFPKYYVNFVQTMEPRKIPVIHFVSFEDLDFKTDVLNRGSKSFLKLEKN